MFSSLKIGNNSKEAPEKTPETEPSQNSQNQAFQSQPEFATSSPENEEPSHFDHLIEKGDDPSPDHAPAPQNQLLSQEQFRQSFIGLHGMAASFSGIKALALPNSHINEGTAHEVADTLYETIQDVPILHFLIQPGNKWLGRALVMAVYVQGMRGAVAQEMAEKRKYSQKMDYSAAKRAAKPQKSHDSGDLTPDQAAALTGL